MFCEWLCFPAHVQRLALVGARGLPAWLHCILVAIARTLRGLLLHSACLPGPVEHLPSESACCALCGHSAGVQRIGRVHSAFRCSNWLFGGALPKLPQDQPCDCCCVARRILMPLMTKELTPLVPPQSRHQQTAPLTARQGVYSAAQP